MGCNCGGSGGGGASGRSFSRGGGAIRTNPDPQEWIVTYPSGQQTTFYSDTDAYDAIYRHGGGIQQQPRTRAGR